KRILIRGFFILLLDPTVISFFSWRLTFQVLYAIGLSMMLMTLLRRLSTFWLVTVALGWIVLGELATGLLWNPDEGTASIPAALTMAMYYAPAFRIMYPLFPWLSMMCLGWAFGRYLNSYLSGQSKWPPQVLLLVTGLIGLGVFAVVRHLNGYGNMFLLREDSSWMQYLLMSKYPPSLGFTAGQLGLLCVILAALITIEPFIGVRKNGPLLVFGQTAMFFYLVHRIVLEGLAQWGGLRGQWGLRETYIAAGVFLVILYPMCLWYRSYKKAHPQGWTQFV
ncbi:MAG: heparan-alpha-glucosaminide N-acetyltransferase domain-containing protein, partial [Planctomycetota bacterium]